MAIKLTTEQKKDFKRIAEIQGTDTEKRGLIAKNKAFLDENESELRKGIVVDGLRIVCRVTKNYVIEEV